MNKKSYDFERSIYEINGDKKNEYSEQVLCDNDKVIRKWCSGSENNVHAALFFLLSFTPSNNEVCDSKQLKIVHKINDRMTTKIMSMTCTIIMNWLRYSFSQMKQSHSPLNDL